MATPTKIVVHFDDGSTFDIDASTTSSIFIGEQNAIKCGHRPPYKTPTRSGGVTELRTLEGSCYYVNGVIFCP